MNAKAWFTIIVSALIIGLSVVYIVKTASLTVANVVLCCCAAIIACRSIQRIVAVTKQMNEIDKE